MWMGMGVSGGVCVGRWWQVLPGVREVRENFVEMVKCPLCTTRERWFGSEEAYYQHWNSVHKCG